MHHTSAKRGMHITPVRKGFLGGGDGKLQVSLI